MRQFGGSGDLIYCISLIFVSIYWCFPVDSGPVPNSDQYGNSCTIDSDGKSDCPVNEKCTLVVQYSGSEIEMKRQDSYKCVCKKPLQRVNGMCLNATQLPQNQTEIQTYSMSNETTGLPATITTTYAISESIPPNVGTLPAIKIHGPTKVQLPAKSVRYEAVLLFPEGIDAENNNVTLNETDLDDGWEQKAQFLWTLTKEDQTSSEAAAESGAWNERSLTLSHLTPGAYLLHVHVSHLEQRSDLAERQVVTAKPLGTTLKVMFVTAPTTNHAPVAKIRPNTTMTVTSNEQLVLDGTGSFDPENDTLKYSWELISGPVLTNALPQAPVLNLNDLRAANYTFGKNMQFVRTKWQMVDESLTVTDTHGQSNSAKVSVRVVEPRDDKPVAKAGQCGKLSAGNFEVRLPLEKIYICGNRSTDDHKIAFYSWKPDPGNEPVDLLGTSTGTLVLANPKEGSYTFTLEVTDNKGQSDTTKVTVFVLKSENKPPSAILAGGQDAYNVTVQLPQNSVVLDGSASSDDGRIDVVSWICEEGPNTPTLHNQDKLKATASNLVEGVYKFVLNVTDDDGLWQSTEKFVNVVHSDNRPPRIVAPDTVTVELSDVGYGSIDASASTDDAGIVQFVWSVNDNSSMALGLGLAPETYFISADTSTLIFNPQRPYAPSQSLPTLLMAPMAAGTYTVNLTVIDGGELRDTKRITVKVLRASSDPAAVELYLKRELKLLTKGDVNRLGKRLESLLAGELQSADGLSVNITSIQPDWSTGRTRLVFHALGGQPNFAGDSLNSASKPLNARLVVLAIRKYADVLEEQFGFDGINEKYCTNPCSEHGVCSDYTKKCRCDGYWMANFVAVYIFGAEDNCDWSVLYFALTVSLLTSGMLCVLYTSGRLPTAAHHCAALCHLPCGNARRRAAAAASLKHQQAVRAKKRRRTRTAGNRWHNKLQHRDIGTKHPTHSPLLPDSSDSAETSGVDNVRMHQGLGVPLAPLGHRRRRRGQSPEKWNECVHDREKEFERQENWRGSKFEVF